MNFPQQQPAELRQALFRPAALQAQKARPVGKIVLINPVSLTFLTSVSALAGVAVIAFLVWGKYTKHADLRGQVVPDLAMIKVYAPQYGIVVERHVGEEQRVTTGDLLYVVSSERLSSGVGETQELISKQIRARQESLRQESIETRHLEESERIAARRRIDGYADELGKLNDMATRQRRRVQLAEETTARFQDLSRLAYVSKQQVIEKQEDLLDQHAKLEDLERQAIDIRRQLFDQKTQLSQLDGEFQQKQAGLEQALASAAQELAESESKRRLEILAPADGIATAVIGGVGQTVDPTKPLVSIVPKGSSVHAELYAPSRAVGFVKVGDPVLLRYDAYPYEKFGHWRGVVTSVSHTALSSGELTSTGRLGDSGSAAIGSEPMYRITVSLKSQIIKAYGRPYALQPGMAAEGDVLQETRRLYEWALEPLTALTGKVH